jgi:L-histidine Nalpha-methyltransferase
LTATRLVPSPVTSITRFRDDVLSGLSHTQKWLPAKYFYDPLGSSLFDRITELDEYYPTRTELAIMQEHVSAMATRCGANCLLIELGAGSLLKVRLLLDELERPAGFVPVDVSGEHLCAAAKELTADYPDIPVHPVVADFCRSFEIPPIDADRRVVYFPGSTIGNFDPPDAAKLLRRVARMVGPGGGLLLGVDLRKDPAVLERAYNDAAGVTASFNLNLLVRINRELGADFEPASFRHRAFYNRDLHRIEMHLVSNVDQSVNLAGRTFRFHAQETIHTENSYKHDTTELARRARDWGFCVDQTWTDKAGYFAVLYLTASGK